MTPTTCLKLTLPAVPASVGRARSAVGDVVARRIGRSRVVDDVRLCVSEAVSNAVRHAYRSSRGEVDVVVEWDNEELRVLVRDAGSGFTRASRRSRIGGYGLTIIDAIALRHAITSSGGGTEVRMTFPAGSEAPQNARSKARVV